LPPQQGNRVVSGDNHGMICVWEKDSGNSVQSMPLAHSKAVLAVSISADGTTVASVGADDKVRSTGCVLCWWRRQSVERVRAARAVQAAW
jgi:WD40 repeat protein